MKITALALAITSAFSFAALAQSSGSPATQDNSMHCMEGMVMPGCPQTDKKHTQSKPPQNAQPQQPKQPHKMDHMPGMQMEPAHPSPSPDTHATMTLLEPENPEQKTGSNLPAPELLTDISARTPMALTDFENPAYANTPPF